MAIRPREEIMDSIKAKFGENTDDETIRLLEDITDTFTDLESKASGDGTDWKARYEENDAEWRKKYTERFFSNETEPGSSDSGETNTGNESKPKTFADLFKTE